MYKHILVPTDGTKLSTRAVRAAVALAKTCGAKMTGLYVIPPYVPPVYSEGMLYVADIGPQRHKELMAKAGYDPSEAPRFWQRFATAQEGNSPLEFLSTHPSDARRASDLEALLPEAMKMYVTAPTRFGLGEGLAISQRPGSQGPAVAPARSSSDVPARAGELPRVSAVKDWWSPQLLATPRS